MRTGVREHLSDPGTWFLFPEADAKGLAGERWSGAPGEKLVARLRHRHAVKKGKPRRCDVIPCHRDFRGKRITRVLLDPFFGASPLLLAGSRAHHLFFHALHLRNIPGRLRNGGASSRTRDRERRDPSDGSLRAPLHRRRYCTPNPGHITARGGPLRPWNLTIVGLIHGTD